LFALRLVGFCLFLSLLSSAQELTIAAASDLQAALPEVVAAFKKASGKKAVISFGSSGNLLAQIQNGAPYDLFFSADVEYPRRLEAAGLVRPGSLYLYAVGRIVVWVPNDSSLDIAREGLQALLGSDVKRIAIANPAHAPYGQAAQSALEKAGIYERVKLRLVLGENISQAAQFVESGNAQAGVIALSLALSPRMQAAGKYWLIPQEMYPRLEQAAVIVKSSKHLQAAQDFLAFLQSPAGLEIMHRYGFVPPHVSPRSTAERKSK